MQKLHFQLKLCIWVFTGIVDWFRFKSSHFCTKNSNSTYCYKYVQWLLSTGWHWYRGNNWPLKIWPKCEKMMENLPFWLQVCLNFVAAIYVIFGWMRVSECYSIPTQMQATTNTHIQSVLIALILTYRVDRENIILNVCLSTDFTTF